MHIIGLKLAVIHDMVAVILPGQDTGYVNKQRVGIHPAVHMANYASGALEGMHATGGHILFVPEHFARIVKSANAMGILDGRWQPDMEQFGQTLVTLYSNNAHQLEPDPDTGQPYPMYYRPLLFEASAELGVGSTADWAMVIVTRTKTPYLGALAKTGVTIWAPGPEHFRRGDKTCGLAGHKVLASYSLGHLWKKRATKHSAVEVLQFNLQNNIAETTGSNVFIVKHGIVFTPELDDSVLDGINRRRVIELLRACGYTVLELQVSSQMFEQADEVFLTGTWSGVVPVQRVLRGWPNVTPWFDPLHCVGPITAVAMELHDKLLHRQLRDEAKLRDQFLVRDDWYMPVR